jgi:uncharacterized protein YceK
MKYILISALIMTTLGGCATSTRSDFTVLSKKNVNSANIKVSRDMMKGNTRGEDCQHIVFGIPFSGPATLDEALDRSLESQHGNILLNAIVEHSWYYIFVPIYGRDCWKIEGVAYDTYK